MPSPYPYPHPHPYPYPYPYPYPTGCLPLTRKQAPDLWRRWGVNLGTGVHRLQLNLLMRGLSLLKDGGAHSTART